MTEWTRNSKATCTRTLHTHCPSAHLFSGLLARNAELNVGVLKTRFGATQRSTESIILSGENENQKHTQEQQRRNLQTNTERNQLCGSRSMWEKTQTSVACSYTGIRDVAKPGDGTRSSWGTVKTSHFLHFFQKGRFCCIFKRFCYISNASVLGPHNAPPRRGHSRPGVRIFARARA